MRYRVKVVDLSEKRNTIGKLKIQTVNNNENDDINGDNASSMMNSGSNEESSRFLIQNWQFEIRKLTYDDAGTYTCLLPLVKPITKNITLQVIRKFGFYLSLYVFF